MIECCTANRNHSKSLRGSKNRYSLAAPTSEPDATGQLRCRHSRLSDLIAGRRYDDLAHELMHAIERIRVQPDPCAVINPGISSLLVTAVRRGAERWAKQHADHLRKTEWMNSRFPVELDFSGVPSACCRLATPGVQACWLWAQVPALWGDGGVGLLSERTGTAVPLL